MTSFSRLVLITGGTRGGLGFEAARQLLRLGHRVVLSFRDAAKAEAACSALSSEFPSPPEPPRVSWILLDHMDLSSVRKGAAELRRRHASIDVLLVCHHGLASVMMVTHFPMLVS